MLVVQCLFPEVDTILTLLGLGCLHWVQILIESRALLRSVGSAPGKSNNLGDDYMWVDNDGTRLTSRGGYYSDNIQAGILSAGPNNLISLNVDNGGFRALVMIGYGWM